MESTLSGPLLEQFITYCGILNLSPKIFWIDSDSSGSPSILLNFLLLDSSSLPLIQNYYAKLIIYNGENLHFDVFGMRLYLLAFSSLKDLNLLLFALSKLLLLIIGLGFVGLNLGFCLFVSNSSAKNKFINIIKHLYLQHYFHHPLIY